MPLQINIATPCHEDWNNMTPAAAGRHCNQCSKAVVDFTGLNSQEILVFFHQNKGANICGRFTKQQTEEPIATPDDFVKKLSYFKIPFLKKAAAIFLFSFSLFAISCNDDHTTGMALANVRKTADSLINTKDTVDAFLTGTPVTQPIKPADTLIDPNYNNAFITGEPAMIEPPKKSLKPKKDCTIPPVMGKVAVIKDSLIVTKDTIMNVPEQVIMGMIAMPAKKNKN